MKRELGVARCGLACCLCSENVICKGCKQNGIVYHREGIMGDYDEFDDLEEMIDFIRTGKRTG